MSSVPTVLAIVGPTASAKTPVSIQLARLLNGEIISADSRQVYKYLDIGTAKPTPEDLKAVPHHFISVFDPDGDYSAGEFGGDARQKVLDVLSRHKLPIVVGGSGLYVRALIDGLFEGPGKDPEIRQQLEDRLATHGPSALLETLKKVDPTSAVNIDVTKPRRIIRALEVYYITGIPISRLHHEARKTQQFRVAQFAIMWERESLYQKINDRVEDMMRQGFVEEVRGLLGRGFDSRYNAMNTVGYRELLQHLSGELNAAEVVDLIKQNTRRLAKRQLTWFRADKRIRWIKGREDLNETVDQLRGKWEELN
ncbi:MAG: tRNA (adenosine(37)-N6)-dimethylallyltransferase MiaA [Ignavibacteriales bacterium]|nr:tRNA (adenosine(37)-N6)-dimethylallyltransferase MiaA [Ignavibacteriales bacterium]